MRQGRFLIALSMLLVLVGTAAFSIFIAPDIHDTPGNITCYGTGGDTVIYKGHVSSAVVGSGGVWYVNDATVKITGDCVFVEDAE